jgi:N-acetylmuramoyl-L-alanine amidase
MAEYQLTATDASVIHTVDGAYIPNDPDNRDWVEYQDWLAKGGVPDPYVLPPPPQPSPEDQVLYNHENRIRELEGQPPLTLEKFMANRRLRKMKIVISSGHGKLVRGASGYLDEVNEARRVVERVAEYLRDMNVDVQTFHDDTSTSQDQNLKTIVDYHNAQLRALDVSVHFNAYETTSKPMGVEVLYVTQEELASTLSEALAEAQGLPDRGGKYRSDLYFLNNTEEPSILIETCFVDSSTDAAAYEQKFEDVCRTIAEVVSGSTVSVPPEPETEPEPEGNRVDIVGAVQGDVTVIINGQVVHGNTRCLHIVSMQITMQGDVTVSINGQDFHNKPSIPTNQTEITASVFGGASDYNTSAYDPNKVLNDTDLYIALPDRFEGERPLVRVYNRETGISATAEIWDVGPWNTDDPYWDKGTRPQAESGTDMQGDETNGAGIDLSPALAKILKVDGMGIVDWEFV